MKEKGCFGKFRAYLVNDVYIEDDTISLDDNSNTRSKSIAERRSSKEIQFHQTVLTATRICAAMVIVLLVAVLVPWLVLHFGKASNDDPYRYCTAVIHERIECISPGMKNTKDVCANMGCCWDNSSELALADLRVPRCFHHTPSEYSYRVSKVKNDPRPHLQLSPDFYRKISGVPPESFKVFFHCESDSHVVITMSLSNSLKTSDPLPCESHVKHSGEGSRFLVNVTDSSGNVIVALGGSPMFFSGSHAEFTVFLLSGSSIFGLGQNTRTRQQLDRHWNQVDIFGNAPTVQTSEGTSTPMSGSYPVYMGIDIHGTSHGFAIKTSDVVLATLHPNRQNSVTFRTVAEKDLEIYVFLGPKPIDVTRQMTAVFGFPELPPFWALGYHTCRRNSSDFNSARILSEKLLNSSFPHESDCIDADISYWVSQELSPADESDLSDLIGYLRTTSRKITLIHTPHTLSSTQLPTVSYLNGQMYRGTHHGIPVSYMDLTNPVIVDKLAEDLGPLWARIPFDGCLLDANTPVDSTPTSQRSCNSTYRLPPVVQGIAKSSVSNNTICLESQHFGNVPHYSIHNEYGSLHSRVVKDVLEKIQPESGKPITVLASLSASLTGGIRGGFWGGELPATYSALRQTVIQLGDTALYGVPFTGFPICGFGLNATRDLCRLWTLLGSFYPLAVTYYDTAFKPRDPVSYDEGFITVARTAMELRYSLLSHLDTLMYHAHIYGDPVIRPLYFEFPEDQMALTVSEQFLWGSGLMVLPVLEPSLQYLPVYFPRGCWYNFHSGIGKCLPEGTNTSIPVTDNEVLVYIRGGQVIARQYPAVTTSVTRQNNFILVSAYEENKMSSGKLILRNDDDLEVMSIKFTSGVNFFESNCTSNCETNFTNNASTIADQIHMYGIPAENSPVSKNITVLSVEGTNNISSFDYAEERGVLLIYYPLDMRNIIRFSWG